MALHRVQDVDIIIVGYKRMKYLTRGPYQWNTRGASGLPLDPTLGPRKGHSTHLLCDACSLMGRDSALANVRMHVLHVAYSHFTEYATNHVVTTLHMPTYRGYIGFSAS